MSARASFQACARSAGWPLERVLFAVAGTVTLSALPAALVLSRALRLRSPLDSAEGAR
jgi:hypothetical protein